MGSSHSRSFKSVLVPGGRVRRLRRAVRRLGWAAIALDEELAEELEKWRQGACPKCYEVLTELVEDVVSDEDRSIRLREAYEVEKLNEVIVSIGEGGKSCSKGCTCKDLQQSQTAFDDAMDESDRLIRMATLASDAATAAAWRAAAASKHSCTVAVVKDSRADISAEAAAAASQRAAAAYKAASHAVEVADAPAMLAAQVEAINDRSPFGANLVAANGSTDRPVSYEEVNRAWWAEPGRKKAARMPAGGEEKQVSEKKKCDADRPVHTVL